MNNTSRYKKIEYKELTKLVSTNHNFIFQIYEIFKENVFTYYGETLEQFSKFLIEKKRTTYLLLNNNEIVSCVLGTGQNKEFEVEYLLTKKKYQRKGNGTKLVLRIIAENRVQNITTTFKDPKYDTEKILEKITGKRKNKSDFVCEYKKPAPTLHAIKAKPRLR